MLIYFPHLVLHMDNIPTWVALTISSTVAVIVAILVQLVVVPWQKKKILGESKTGQPVKFTFGDSDGELTELSFERLSLFFLTFK